MISNRIITIKINTIYLILYTLFQEYYYLYIIIYILFYTIIIIYNIYLYIIFQSFAQPSLH